jgi:membrane protein DedA with SNARE-associated domain
MQRHGGKAVFFGRFIAVVRFTIAWIAGLTEMSWPRFLAWNAAGGIAWATSVGLIAFYGGRAAANAISRYGVYAAVAVGAIAIGGWFVLRRAQSRFEDRDESPAGKGDVE